MNIRTFQYGPLPEQTVDLYLNQDISRPLIVYVHGGAWIRGSKDDVTPLVQPICDYGFNIASLNYRLAPSYRFPDAQNDLERCLTYLESQGYPAAGLLGVSVGGTMALTAASKRRLPVVTWSAIVQIEDWVNCHCNDDSQQANFYRSFLSAYLGDLKPNHLRQLDPLSKTIEGPPAALMFNATDELVPLSDALTFYDRLYKINSPSTLSIIDGSSHAQAYFKEALPDTIIFFMRQ